jgi:hypothetical protein
VGEGAQLACSQLRRCSLACSQLRLSGVGALVLGFGVPVLKGDRIAYASPVARRACTCRMFLVWRRLVVLVVIFGRVVKVATACFRSPGFDPDRGFARHTASTSPRSGRAADGCQRTVCQRAIWQAGDLLRLRGDAAGFCCAPAPRVMRGSRSTSAPATGGPRMLECSARPGSRRPPTDHQLSVIMCMLCSEDYCSKLFAILFA